VSGCETSMHRFSCSGGTGRDSTKRTLGHVTLNLCFLHLVGSTGHVVHFGASMPRNFDSLLFKLGWAQYGFLRNRVVTYYANLCFCIWLDLRVT
jgi:hypothetical protein